MKKDKKMMRDNYLPKRQKIPFNNLKKDNKI